jgi:anti-anti-sigma factor
MPIPEAGSMPVTREGGEGVAIESARAGSTVVLTVRGELDLRTVPTLRARLAEALATGHGAVVVDLTGVAFMDSTGLATLLNALRRLTRAGRRLVLTCGDGPVRRMLHLTHLLGTFTVCDHVDAALAHLERTQGPAAA